MTCIVLCLCSATWATETVPTFSNNDLAFFESKVRPLLIEHCYECHSTQSGEDKGGLLLDSRAGLLTGGDTEPAIVPGKPDESLLIDAVRYGDLYQMPPKYQLAKDEVNILVEWVNRNAPWPAESQSEVNEKKKFDINQRKQSHWAWRPLTTPDIPQVADTTWPHRSLDHFILAKLEAKQLTPAADIDPRSLVRRAYFDVIGLPPPPEVVSAYAENPSQQAFANLIDHLLSMPEFGERWARHWLDLMRYAETRGHEFDYAIPNAWQYRDYVIRAFNADVPYSQFVIEHIAGDLVEAPRKHPEKQFNESVLGTAFWYLGDWIHSPVDLRQDEMNRIDNALDVFGKAFLGLTVSCARCHDHKFDAIAQRDYYALAGYLQSSAYRQVRFETEEHNLQIAKQLQELNDDASSTLSNEIVKLLRENSNSSVSQLLLNAAKSLLANQANEQNQHPLYPLALYVTQGPEAYNAWIKESATSKPLISDSHQVIIDYNQDTPLWLTDGPAFGTKPQERGDLQFTKDPTHPIRQVVSQGHAKLHSELANLTLTKGTEKDAGKIHDWAARPGRIIRTPTFTLTGKKIYYLILGGAQVQAVVASHRMISGPLHNQFLKDIPATPELRWVEHDLSSYQGQRLHVEFGPRQDEPFELYSVVIGDNPPPLPYQSPAQLVAQRLSDVTSLEELNEQYSQLLTESLTQLEQSTLDSSPAHLALANWTLQNISLFVKEDQLKTLQPLLDAYHADRNLLLSQIKHTSATAPAIWDGTGQDTPLLVRGNVRTPGKPVPRAMLTALRASSPEPKTTASGRLKLARDLFAPDNPFPARVMANRIWHHLMGRGIVPSVDDFGVLGQPPTHPELLDHLAQKFVAEGWSIKSLIRHIMLSHTYQMASQHNEQAAEVDPQNLLFHRMPIRRLQAEVIRDAMLSLSGKLNPSHFGPSTPVHLTSFMQGRGRPKNSGPLDGDGRRSIYISVRRNFLSPMMLAFDTPQPNVPMGRRTVSNVPAQALILMNDPFVVEQAQHFANRILENHTEVTQAIHQLYLEALARPPRAEEVAAAQEFLTQQSQLHSQDPNPLHPAAWADLCHTLFNTKEFIYLK